MSKEIARWGTTGPVYRAREREVAQIRKEVAVAGEKIMGATLVTDMAMKGASMLSQTKRQLEQYAPEDAGDLAYLRARGVMAMGNAIDALGWQ